MSIKFYHDTTSDEVLVDLTVDKLNQLADERNLRRSETESNISYEITWGELKDALNTYASQNQVDPNKQIRYAKIFNSFRYTVTLYILAMGQQNDFDAYSQYIELVPSALQLPDQTVITISFDKNRLPDSVRASMAQHADIIAQQMAEQADSYYPEAGTDAEPEQSQETTTSVTPISISPATTVEGFGNSCARNLFYYFLVFLVVVLILFILFWGGCSIAKAF